MESLIQAGAFDCVHANRNQLLESLDDAVQYAVRKQEEESRNQFSLFGGENGSQQMAEPRLREVMQPWTNMEKLKREREHIGFYLSSHPLNKYKDDIRLFSSHTLAPADWAEVEDRAQVKVAGIITTVKQVRDKKGRPFAFITMEDKGGSIEVITFSDAFDRCMNLIQPDTIVMVDGHVDMRDGTPKIIARNLERIENLREQNQAKIRLCMMFDTQELSDEDIAQVGRLCGEHKGQSSIRIRVRSPHVKNLRLGARRFVVDPSDELLREVRAILGKDRVYLEKAE